MKQKIDREEKYLILAIAIVLALAFLLNVILGTSLFIFTLIVGGGEYWRQILNKREQQKCEQKS